MPFDMTIERFDAMTTRERREYAALYPYETGAMLLEHRRRYEVEAEPVTTIGYWRPIADGPDYSAAQRTEDDLLRVRAGRRPGQYYPDIVIAAAGAESLEQYLVALATRERAAADALWALPIPIPGALDAEEAERLAAWLEGGREVASYRGSSRCRICGTINGSTELERDGYRYPSGLAHYVRVHRVAVPGLQLPA